MGAAWATGPKSDTAVKAAPLKSAVPTAVTRASFIAKLLSNPRSILDAPWGVEYLSFPIVRQLSVMGYRGRSEFAKSGRLIERISSSLINKNMSIGVHAETSTMVQVVETAHWPLKRRKTAPFSRKAIRHAFDVDNAFGISHCTG
jgi:hypothetical protein